MRNLLVLYIYKISHKINVRDDKIIDSENQLVFRTTFIIWEFGNNYEDQNISNSIFDL